MNYYAFYSSPIGKILISCDDLGLTGLYFTDDEQFEGIKNSDQPFIKSSLLWLNTYFAGEVPNFTPPLHLEISSFQKSVYKHTCQVSYGKLASYKELADIVAKEKGIAKMSCQAIGTALHNNPISLIIPCHRIIASHNKIGGYGWGEDKKRYLLTLEGSIKNIH